MAVLENLTIMFTDIVGFADLVSKLSRAESEKLLKKHDQILHKIIRQFGGKVVKCIGDSFLVVFRSPTDAVLCGMALQDALWEANHAAESGEPIIIRVAINSGEVRLTNQDVFGDAVNIASRLEQVTPPGAVYLSGSVYLAMSKSEVNLEKVKSFQFKGVEEEVQVYRAGQSSAGNHFSAVFNADDPNDHSSHPSNHFPFGGAHLSQRAHNAPTSRLVMWASLSFCFISAIFLTWWLTSTFTPISIQDKIIVEYTDTKALPKQEQEKPNVDILDPTFIVTSQLKIKADQLLKAKDYLGLEKLVIEHEQQYQNNGYLHLIDAHTHTYFKRYEKAVRSYKKAFEIDEILANDPLAAKNLIKLLKQQRKPTNRLVAQFLKPEIIQRLSERTSQPGLQGRYDAFYLLKDSGNTDAIDLVGLNIWDLRELKKCQLKKVSVLELERLKDKRALPALKELLNVKFLDRIKYSCLRKDLQKAIMTIEEKKA